MPSNSTTSLKKTLSCLIDGEPKHHELRQSMESSLDTISARLERKLLIIAVFAEFMLITLSSSELYLISMELYNIRQVAAQLVTTALLMFDNFEVQ